MKTRKVIFLSIDQLIGSVLIWLASPMIAIGIVPNHWKTIVAIFGLIYFIVGIYFTNKFRTMSYSQIGYIQEEQVPEEDLPHSP